MKGILNYFIKYPYLTIALIWFLIQFLIFTKYGIVTELEAKKYVDAGKYLLVNGSFPEKKYIFYALTPLLIAFNLKIGFGIIGSVLMQLFLNFLSTILFYKICLQLTKNILSALIVTILLICLVPYQIWNVYLYTESIFFSCIIIFLYLLLKYFSYTKFNAKKIKLIILLPISFVAILAARPFGVLFIPALILMMVIQAKKRFMPLAILFIIAASYIMYVSLNRAFSGSVDWNAMVSNINGHIICDIRDDRYASDNLLLLTSGNPVDQLLYYVVNNPKHFIILSAERMFAFFNITRSYYSFWNNCYLTLSMIIVYGSMLLGLKTFYKVLYPFRLFILLSIGIYTLATTLQCDDYHSRFIMALYPFFLIIGSFGIKHLIEEVNGKTY